MKTMGFSKKIVLGLMLAFGLTLGVHASEGGLAWDKAPNKTNDMGALQNGAKLFVNGAHGISRWCSGKTLE